MTDKCDIDLEQFLLLKADFESRQLISYIDDNIPRFIDERSFGEIVSGWYLGYGQGTDCVEYKQYVVITVLGDCDYIYFYNKDLHYITHSYTNNWDWSSGYVLNVDTQHVDTVVAFG